LIQPLYGPDDDLYLTYGFRLGTDFWDVDQDKPDPTFAQIARTARRDALPFFDQVPDLDRFAEVVPKWAEATPRRIMQHHTLDDPAVAEDLAGDSPEHWARRAVIGSARPRTRARRKDRSSGSERSLAARSRRRV
jgi:hypothetical protein